MAEYKIRSAQGSDLAFIFDTFLKSYKMSSPVGRACRNGIFFDNYRLVLDDILENAKTYVACLPDEPTVIFGYLIADKATIHYVFVKEAFRNLGIDKALYNEALIEADPMFGFLYTTHKTNYSDKIESFKVPYNPFRLYEAVRKREENGTS